jgi:hypothetical protein
MSSLQPSNLPTLTQLEIEILNDMKLKLEAYGPRKKVGDVSKQFEGPFKDPICVVCWEKFGDDPDESPSRQLNTCTHVLHSDCLDGLINGAYTTDVVCPLCRAKICDPRPCRQKTDVTGH